MSTSLLEVGTSEVNDILAGISETEARQAQSLQKGGQTVDIDKCVTAKAFREAAKEILLKDPSQIGPLIEKARQMRDKFVPGFNALYWNMGIFHDRSENLSKPDYENLVRWTFEKANAQRLLSRE